MTRLTRSSSRHRISSVVGFRGLPGHANQSRTLLASGALASLSLYGPSINFCLASHLDYHFSTFTTAAIMYFFALAALLFAFIQMKVRANWTSGVALTLFSLCGIWVLWTANYFIGYFSAKELSPYDYNRPAFAFYGIVVFGLLGVIASRDPASFLHGFLKYSIVNSLILAVLYLPLYDSNVELSRIGGDAGLIIGILLSQGVASILSMIWLGWFSYVAGLFSVPLLFSAIIMSGTRSALLATVLVLAIFFTLLHLIRFRKLSQVAGSLIFFIAFTAGIYFSVSFIPEATQARITNFNFEGSENRWTLLVSAWSIFSDFPLGRVTGYIGMFPANIEYAHNAAAQILLEAGIFSLVFLCLLMVGCVRAVLVNHRVDSQILRGFIFYAIPVYLVSFSAGDAYNPQFWLVTTLLATSGLDFYRRDRRVTIGAS